MKKLKIVSMGDKVQGVILQGNPKNPEPDHFRVVFPGGDIDIVRCTGEDPDYWVHIRVNHPDREGWDKDALMGKICDARLDQTDKHASDADVGDFDREELYHLAVRVTHRPNQ